MFAKISRWFERTKAEGEAMRATVIASERGDHAHPHRHEDGIEHVHDHNHADHDHDHDHRR